MMDFSALTKAIEEADSITIFRHIHPDCDAFGSQFGLKSWISENYPDKKVYACGSEPVSQGIWPQNDACSDEIIQNSLAIVTDTATAARADDQRFLQAKKIIKIDHHPQTDPYGDLQYVDPKAASASEILAAYFRSTGKHVSSETAAYLYKGILTDTLRFSTSNTTSDTLGAAAWLSTFGIDIPALNRELFDLDMKEFHLAAVIRAKVKPEPSGFAWLILSNEELKELGFSGSDARGHIDEIGHVRDFKVWAMFTETEDHYYDGSLRSKKAAVNTIAAQYGGGGHKNAAGVKHLSSMDLDEIKGKLNQAALEE